MLRDVYASADRHAAEAALADWHTCAGAYDVVETNRLARTLRSWETELLAYFDERLTTVPPKARTASSKPSNGKDSATPTPKTTAGASSTAAHDTLNPPDNRTPLPHQKRRAANVSGSWVSWESSPPSQ